MACLYKLQDAPVCSCCLLSRLATAVPRALFVQRTVHVDLTQTRHLALAVAKQRNAKNSYGLVSTSFPLAFLEKSPRPARALMMPSREVTSEAECFVLVKWVKTRLSIGGEGLA